MRRSKTGARKMIVSPALECVLLLALECVVVPFIRMCSLTCIAPQQDRGAQDDRGHEHSGNFPHHQWRLCRHRRGVHQGPVSCLHFLFFSLLYFVVMCFHTPLCFTATCYHTLLYFTLIYCMRFFALPCFTVCLSLLYSTLLYFGLLYFTLLYLALLYAFLYSTLLYVIGCRSSAMMPR